MNVAPLFSVLYIVGYCDMVKLIVWSKPVCALLCRLPEQESPPCMVRIGRRRHPHRSTQTSASVGADICIGRRRCINRRVWHPCHTHAATSTPSARSHPPRSHIISRLRGYGRDAIPSYRLRGYSRDAIPSYRLRGYSKDAIPSYR